MAPLLRSALSPTDRSTSVPRAGLRARRTAAVPTAVLTGALAGLLTLLSACSPTADPAPTRSPAASSTASEPAEPADPEPTPSETVPAPDEDSAVGDLAEGFPGDLLPLPEDAEILVSTYGPQGDAGAGQPYGVSLNLRTSLPVADVAALYRTSLTAAGFTETVGTPTAGLAAESTYSRSAGDELLTVGVLDRDDLRTVTVGGRLLAPADATG